MQIDIIAQETAASCLYYSRSFEYQLYKKCLADDWNNTPLILQNLINNYYNNKKIYGSSIFVTYPSSLNNECCLDFVKNYIINELNDNNIIYFDNTDKISLHVFSDKAVYNLETKQHSEVDEDISYKLHSQVRNIIFENKIQFNIIKSYVKAVLLSLLNLGFYSECSIDNIKKIMNTFDLYKVKNTNLTRIKFDRHLLLPLLKYTNCYSKDRNSWKQFLHNNAYFNDAIPLAIKFSTDNIIFNQSYQYIKYFYFKHVINNRSIPYYPNSEYSSDTIIKDFNNKLFLIQELSDLFYSIIDNNKYFKQNTILFGSASYIRMIDKFFLIKIAEKASYSYNDIMAHYIIESLAPGDIDIKVSCKAVADQLYEVYMTEATKIFDRISKLSILTQDSIPRFVESIQSDFEYTSPKESENIYIRSLVICLCLDSDNKTRKNLVDISCDIGPNSVNSVNNINVDFDYNYNFFYNTIQKTLSVDNPIMKKAKVYRYIFRIYLLQILFENNNFLDDEYIAKYFCFDHNTTNILQLNTIKNKLIPANIMDDKLAAETICMVHELYSMC